MCHRARSDVYFDQRLRPALGSLLESAVAAGEVRADVEPDDLLHAVANLCLPAGPGGDDRSGPAQRMVALLIDGPRRHSRHTPRQPRRGQADPAGRGLQGQSPPRRGHQKPRPSPHVPPHERFALRSNGIVQEPYVPSETALGREGPWRGSSGNGRTTLTWRFDPDRDKTLTHPRIWCIYAGRRHEPTGPAAASPMGRPMVSGGDEVSASLLADSRQPAIWGRAGEPAVPQLRRG
jgi:hypothetical protein